MEGKILLYTTLALVLFTGGIVLIVCLQLLQLIHYFLQKEAVNTQPSAGIETFWERINKRFIAGNLTPVAQESDIMLDHSYDGIQELDNHMPPWLKYLFYSTIGFAVVYLINFFALGLVPTSSEEYIAEVSQAEKQVAEYRKSTATGIDENNAKLITDAGMLEGAKAIFEQNCKACHGGAGEGGVGPNLTDAYWLHGGDVKDVFKTIKYGVPQKGMISWQQKLKPVEIQNVASYILSLQGTNPPNGKAAEGDKMVSTQINPGVQSISMTE